MSFLVSARVGKIVLTIQVSFKVLTYSTIPADQQAFRKLFRLLVRKHVDSCIQC